MAFSVALGFDNFVVIRHGYSGGGVGGGGGAKTEANAPSGSRSTPSSESTHVPYSDLSCYFCSDVTAPGNSTADR